MGQRRLMPQSGTTLCRAWGGKGGEITNWLFSSGQQFIMCGGPQKPSTLFNKLVQGKFLNYIGIILQLEEKYVSESPYI
jgi:hypothetical protein